MKNTILSTIILISTLGQQAYASQTIIDNASLSINVGRTCDHNQSQLYKDNEFSCVVNGSDVENSPVITNASIEYKVFTSGVGICKKYITGPLAFPISQLLRAEVQATLKPMILHSSQSVVFFEETNEFENAESQLVEKYSRAKLCMARSYEIYVQLTDNNGQDYAISITANKSNANAIDVHQVFGSAKLLLQTVQVTEETGRVINLNVDLARKVTLD